MYGSELVDTLVNHTSTNGVWSNSLARRPPWLYASSVKKKNKNNLEKHIFATVKTNELMAKMKEKLGSI